MGSKRRHHPAESPSDAQTIRPTRPRAPLINPPQLVLDNKLTLIPKEVRAAATKHRKGKLLGKVVLQRFAADDGPILRFLETLSTEDEALALTRLAGLLRNYPMMLEHPYVWSVIRRLYGLWSLDEDLNKYIQSWLTELLTAWVEGMTVGKATLRAKKPSRKQARPPRLFPQLTEQEGWLPSAAAKQDQRDALDFLALYKELHAGLGKCFNWKKLCTEFRDDPDKVVSDVSWRLQDWFEPFKKKRGLQAPTHGRREYQKIAREGFNEVYKHQSPRHQIACQLIATLEWIKRDGQPVPLTSSLVHKTLTTLRKHFPATISKEPIRRYRYYKPSFRPAD